MYWSVFSQLVEEKGAECQFSQLLLIQHLSYNIPYMMISLTELNPVLPVSMIFDSVKYSRSQWCWDSCIQVKLSSDFVWLLVYGQRHTHVFCVYLRGAVGVSCSELRSCVKVEVAVLGSPSIRSLMVSVDVKNHDRKKKCLLSAGAHGQNIHAGRFSKTQRDFFETRPNLHWPFHVHACYQFRWLIYLKIFLALKKLSDDIFIVDFLYITNSVWSNWLVTQMNILHRT